MHTSIENYCTFHQGYGLGMFVELLCGLTSGSMYAHKVRRWTEHHRDEHIVVELYKATIKAPQNSHVITIMAYLRNSLRLVQDINCAIIAADLPTSDTSFSPWIRTALHQA